MTCTATVKSRVRSQLIYIVSISEDDVKEALVKDVKHLLLIPQRFCFFPLFSFSLYLCRPDLDPLRSVGELKVIVAQNSDISADQHQLIYKGQILNNNGTLESYGSSSILLSNFFNFLVTDLDSGFAVCFEILRVSLID